MRKLFVHESWLVIKTFLWPPVRCVNILFLTSKSCFCKPKLIKFYERRKNEKKIKWIPLILWDCAIFIKGNNQYTYKHFVTK